MVQKYIDSPNEEFLEEVTVYEKGVKKVQREGVVHHQGEGTDTGIVRRQPTRTQ